MSCFSDDNVEKDFKQQIKSEEQQIIKQKSQPLKFKILRTLGLKKYIMDKFVFVRPPVKYTIQKEGPRWTYHCKTPLEIPEQYNFQVQLIEDQTHSLPAASIILKDRTGYKGTVIYSHGNSSDLSDSLSFVASLAKNLPVFDYVTFDYSGYGQSNKKQLTDESLCQDLQLLINNLKVDYNQIILWGFSLGAYPTVKAAVGKPLLGVIVHSSMASLYSLMDNPSIFDRVKNDTFNVIQILPKVNSFIIILHSRDDEIIPFSHAQSIFQRYRHLNPNPFCFLIETSLLKHNHMHAMLTSSNENELKSKLFKTIALMLQPQSLPKAQFFKLSKQRYFEQIKTNTGKGRLINIDAQSIQPPTPANNNHSEGINFKKVKKVQFQFDDIENQQITRVDHYLDVKTRQHPNYFTQTEPEQPPRPASLLKSDTIRIKSYKEELQKKSRQQIQSINSSIKSQRRLEQQPHD